MREEDLRFVDGEEAAGAGVGAVPEGEVVGGGCDGLFVYCVLVRVVCEEGRGKEGDGGMGGKEKGGKIPDIYSRCPAGCGVFRTCV